MGNPVRLALRGLRRRPGFTLVAGATLALGVGANAAIFGVVDAVLFRGLDFREPDALVRVWPENFFSKQEAERFRELAGSYEGLATYFGWASVGLAGAGDPEVADGAFVSAGLFDVLGVRPALGRTFLPGEDRSGAENVMVLGWDLWQRRYGGDEGVLGRRETVDGETRTIVGVMPEGFRFPLSANELWLPAVLDPADEVDWTSSYLQMVGRLRRGVTPEEAAAEIRAIAPTLRRELGLSERYGETARVVPLREAMAEWVRPALLALLGAVGLVLLIATVNVANLSLTRAAARAGELAVRRALGAGHGAILRLLLAESMALAALSGIAASGLALAAMALVRAHLPPDLPRLHEIGPHPRLVLYTLLLSLAVGAVLGLLPAFAASRRHPGSALRRDGRSAGDRRRSRGTELLVGAEVALAVLVVLAAGLIVQSFHRVTRVDPGLDVDRVLVVYPLPPSDPYGDLDRQKVYYERVRESLAAVPGVEAVGGIHAVPVLQGGFIGSVEVEGAPADRADRPGIQWRVVTPGYFEATGVPLLAGRRLEESDREGGPPVALVNAALARTLWPGESPLGRRLRHGLEDEDWATVVGVVGDVRQSGLDREPAPEMYRPLAQNDRPVGLGFAVRTAGDPAALVPLVRRAVHDIDDEVPLRHLHTLRQIVQESVAQPRLLSLLFALFASLALLLGAIGIYGVVHQAVQRRRREIGIRLALGADRHRILRLVLVQGMAPVVLGLGAGLVAATALARTLTGLLFQVAPTDPATYFGTGVLLALVAAAAAGVPALAATRVDPVRSLRAE